VIVCHVIAPAHTRLVKHVWSTCPFTQRTITLIKALRLAGYQVVDYSNYGSESEANEHVEILPKDAYDGFGISEGKIYRESPTAVAQAFGERVEQVARDTIRARDINIIMYAWGRPPTSSFATTRPGETHVEPGVGYDAPPWGAYRIYESEAWRHYLWGKYGTDPGSCRYSWVIPWPFDPVDWPAVVGAERQYVSFLGRLAPDKGLPTLSEVAQALPYLRFKVAGVGPIDKRRWPSNIELVGPIYGEDRVAFLSKSIVHLCPTDYIEPFGGSAVEGMLCGAPVVASDYGGYTETVIPGVTGFRANTLQEWIDGVGAAAKLDRVACREATLARLSVTAAADKYKRAITRLAEKYTQGWYTRR
jgi:hypothetical protein